MTTQTIPVGLNLPWVEGREDRLFKRLLIISTLLFLIIGMFMNSITLPETQQQKLMDIAPRLAKLIVEKNKIPPPPKPVKKEIKKPEPKKKKEVKKPQEKPKPVTKPKPKPKPVDTRAAARRIAEKSGLMALQDDLADLRESFDVTDIGDKPQLKTGKQAETIISTSDFLTAKASQGSGGIKTDTLNRQIKSSELAQRKTSQIKSKIESASKITSNAIARKSRTARRSQEEIERVFQKNKGAIFNIYNRELRKDPTLQGKVIVELTIAANGSVTKCIIVSSELGHEKLEKRLLSKIKKFIFSSKKVPAITVTYPIDFLPS